MKAAGLTLALVAVALGGCSLGSSSLSTGSLLSDGKPATPTADPPARAFQVGTASARAVKCGFNFDPGKLKANYLAYEKQQAPGQDTAKIERIYDVSFNGVAKAVAAEGDYCSDAKTRKIKADLTRHLAGDYTPNAPEEEQDSGGLFSGWGSGGSDTPHKKTTLPTDNSND
jgi:hypothetical protein